MKELLESRYHRTIIVTESLRILKSVFLAIVSFPSLSLLIL